MSAFVADVSQWDAWRPEDVHPLLAKVEVPWYVAAGWAIDLFLGGERREHEDLEIAVPAERFHEIVDALPKLDVFVIGPEPGFARPLASVEHLLESTHQTWVREPATGPRISAAARARSETGSARGASGRSRSRPGG
jgi:hypothetical protein